MPIKVFNPWKIQINSDDFDKHMPMVYKAFPFMKEWNSTWYMYKAILVLYQLPPTGDCYLLTQTKNGGLALFRAEEGEGGYLVPKDSVPIEILNENSD